MRVSVVQMNPGADKTDNIAQARRLLDAAITADRPDIVSLPEVWTCLGGTREGKFAQAEDLPAKGSNALGGPAYEFLREVARGGQVFVHGGSMQERGGERLFNTTVVFDPEGRRSRAIARSTCSTSPPPTAPASAKATPTSPATRP